MTAAAALGLPRSAAAAELVAAQVASVNQLKEPWSHAEFIYRDGADEVRGIVIALPGGDLFGAAMPCPHEGCPLQFKTDPQEISDTYDVKVGGPALVCPCHLSVFDLSRGGAVIAGPAQRPPYRFTLVIRDGQVFADGLERRSS